MSRVIISVSQKQLYASYTTYIVQFTLKYVELLSALLFDQAVTQSLYVYTLLLSKCSDSSSVQHKVHSSSITLFI